ncbi:PAS-domain containing protein [Pelagibius marinus]|uniref:PAS-domain containing protein n=1 Tax=Pelagibius marinus TaxID=2762760 RepID=UPI00187218C0|nr:PAS-domain containing protein [Pelagibius marinus]
MTKDSPESAQLRLLQAALDHINQGFTVFDNDLRLVGWNRRFFELLGFPLSLARMDTPFSAFMRYNAERGEYGEGDIDELVAERVTRAAAFEPHELERRRPTGEIISVRGTPLPEGGFVTTYTDVTEQRQRQEILARVVAERTRDLHESEQRLRLITDAIPALIATIDTEPKYTFANKRYAEWFGRTVDEIVGMRVEQVLEPDLYAELQLPVSAALEGREVTYEYRRKGPDGRHAEMRSTLIPDRDDEGKIRGCFVLSLDVTEQRHQEAVLSQAQRMEAVGRLTGGIAHDFNNLLTIILGNLVALRGKIEDEQQLTDYLEPAVHAAQRGADLTNRLLTFARGGEFQVQSVDVEAVVADMSRLLRRSLPSSVEVATKVRGVPRSVLADPGQLENALLNLALNARDAMHDAGRIVFDVSELHLAGDEAQHLEVSTGDYVRLLVEDSGQGMDEETRRRVFEPFFTTKQFGSGSGLGLSMVYGFVRQSGGGVTIESEPGGGTRVALFLPCAKAKSDAELEKTPDAAVETPHGKGELVLLVEDDPTVRAVVRRQLVDLGYGVLEAEDAQEALQFINSVGEIRYLISDIVMQGEMNGLSLAETAKEVAPEIRIGLITGYAEPRDGHLPATCPYPTLAKPFATEALATLIGRTV